MNNEQLQKAIELIDQANGEDPNAEIWQGQTYPKELLYSQRMSEWLERLDPQANDAQRLAARAQHIRRWQVPRTAYPATREGYLTWRKFLYRFHAEQAAALVLEAGYDAVTIEAVQRMLLKQGIKRDPDVQLIEDTACMVFLQYYFPAFANEHSEEKLVDIVRKTWKKMSETAHTQALTLKLPDSLLAIVTKAISDIEASNDED